MFKNLLFGLGGIGVVSGGGYMIYNATKSSNENQVEGINQEGETAPEAGGTTPNKEENTPPPPTESLLQRTPHHKNI